MKKWFFGVAVWAFFLAFTASGFTQTHIYVTVPDGKIFSDTTTPVPSATIGTNEWSTHEGYGELTGKSVYPPVADSDQTQATGEMLEVTITIPTAGEWWMWVHYQYPFAQVSAFKPSFFVVDSAGQYISSPSGPSATPAAFLDDNIGSFGLWAWDGAPGDDTSIDANSVGASLGNIPAGQYTLTFYRRETSEGTGGATADPLLNPHFEAIYLTNGGSTDRPSDEAFLSTQAFSAVRSMTPPTYPGFGGPINISVTAKPERETGGAVTVSETVPTGLRIDNVVATSGSASASGQVITWAIPDLTAAQTLSYTVYVNSGESKTFSFAGNAVKGSATQVVSGQANLTLLSFFIFETFAYPSGGTNDNEGKGLTEVTQPLGGGATPLNNGWATLWSDKGSTGDKLNTRIIDAGLVTSQPQEYNPGNFCLELSGDGTNGVSRSIKPVNTGEVWLSFTFLDEGPAANHWAGITLYGANGNEVSFVGKPYNATSSGIGNLPGGDSLAAGKDYKQPHHYLVRYVLQSGAGQNDSVYLWIDPDATDTLATFDAGGENNDEISDIAELRLRRGGAAGSAFWDNIILASVPALPPAGSGRVDLKLNDPNRPAELPAWDVVCIDQVDDAMYDGTWGFGHDNNDTHYLLVSGYIYWQNANQTGNQMIGWGLPPDHISGLNGHVLGDYNNQFDETGLKNSMKFENSTQQKGPFTFDVVPAGKYAELRAVMTVGNGDGELYATFHYDDGTTSQGVFHADDWYDDPPQLTYNDVFQLVNGMNRIDGSKNFDGRFDPAFFENAAQVDPTKVLKQVTLEKNTTHGSSLNLFDILAIPEKEIVGIEEWQLY
ncbi:MAG: hypothetical protein RBU29_12275 [bacterium]|jgi:hypothetical protein|nr:hypothetical protein [bacterium]